MTSQELSEPVSAEAFAAALDALDPHPPLAVAVSGGADSMALLRLAHRWTQAREAPLFAFTVDHRMRTAAAEEARQVGNWCADLGITHRTLVWEQNRPQNRGQAEARAARYGLLADACSQAGASCLLVGHHMEDQAETLLLRLMRGSGVDGLAAMRPETRYQRLRLLRPLLGFSRAALRATLTQAGQEWIEDPSNQDPKYARVRVRQILDMLGADDMPVRRLADTARRMGRARTALAQMTDRLLANATTLDPAGFVRLSGADIIQAPEEIGLRALARIVTTIGGKQYTPRQHGLEQLYEWVCNGPATAGHTLAGCHIFPHRNALMVIREAASIGPGLPLRPGASGTWDARFDVSLKPAPLLKFDPVVRAVGAQGARQIRQISPDLQPADMPAAAARVVPGLWHGDTLLAAPQLGFTDPAHPELTHAFVANFAPARNLLPVEATGF